MKKTPVAFICKQHLPLFNFVMHCPTCREYVICDSVFHVEALKSDDNYSAFPVFDLKNIPVSLTRCPNFSNQNL